MEAKYIGKKCPYCKTLLTADDDIVICSSCEMPHHKECWVDNNGCTTFGCTGTIASADGGPVFAAAPQYAAVPYPGTQGAFGQNAAAYIPPAFNSPALGRNYPLPGTAVPPAGNGAPAAAPGTSAPSATSVEPSVPQAAPVTGSAAATLSGSVPVQQAATVAVHPVGTPVAPVAPGFAGMIQFCSSCGAKRTGGGRFCQACGASFSVPGTMNPGAAATCSPAQPTVQSYPQAKAPQSTPVAQGIAVQSGYSTGTGAACYPQANVSRSFEPQVPQQGSAFPGQAYSVPPSVQANPIDRILYPLIASNQDYYIPRYHRIISTGDKFDWNWCAFLFNSFWLIYRKMYAFGVPLLLLNVLLSYMGRNGFVGYVICVIYSAAAGLFANYLYTRQLEGHVRRALTLSPEQQNNYTRANGGTSIVAVVIAAVIFLIIDLVLFSH